MSKHKETFLDLLEIALVGTAVFFLVYIFIGQLLQVTGDSMHPTLKNQEQIIAEKLSIRFRPLERGEIVVFKHPTIKDRLLIKRVIALPDDTMFLSKGDIYVNGTLLKEHYLANGNYTLGKNEIREEEEYVVTKGYVLMGDNRLESSDSREFGPIALENIVGRALIVYYPLENFRLIHN